jgi:hypothetical protein
MGVLFLDDFADLAHWSAGSFSISPAGWAYHGGDGSATGMAMHAMESGCAFVEALVYGDAGGGDNWFTIKLGTSGGAGYDQNGAALLIRSTDGQLGWIAANAAVSWTDPSFASGHVSPVPNSAANAVLLGIHKLGGGVYDAYVNRKKVQTVTGVTNDAGAYIGMCAYNGIGAHVDYVATADRPLTGYDDLSPSRLSKLVLG